jgi:hypothetical protein
VIRQVLAVAVGIVLSFLAVPAGGYLVYQISHSVPNEGSLGRVIRHILQPALALLVGACVGALAKSRPSLVAAFSLIPSQLAFFSSSWRRIEGHLLLFVCLGMSYLLIAALSAGLVFAARTRGTKVSPQS